MRLDKYICESSPLTRNEAKRCLKKGLICINGEVVKNGALQIASTDVITFEGQQLQKRGQRYIMLNKPQDFISSTQDELYPSLLHLLDIDKAFDLHIAGRLDVDTTGLVLITDDGKWSHQITSPKKHCPKRYRVLLAEAIGADAEEKFSLGLELKGEDKPTQPATLEIISPREVLLTITEGKYHQVKRMFAALGNKVEALHREKIAAIELDKQLASGQWRYLSEQEISSVYE
jgi:16S rRNA pseudouridine516 synthase